jgi:hypothetical protein
MKPSEKEWSSKIDHRLALADQAFAVIDVKSTTKSQLVELCRQLAREMKGAVRDLKDMQGLFNKHAYHTDKNLIERDGAIRALEDVLVRLINGDCNA